MHPLHGGRSLHVQHQPLQVLPLRMVDIYGMVSRLRQLMEYPDIAPRNGSRREDRRSEKFAAHRLRTTESKENTSGSYLRERPCVQAHITFHGVAQHLVVLREGRRVENDEVETAVHPFQVIERIDRHPLVRCAVAEIERDIPLREADGTSRAVHRYDPFRPARQSVYGETAGITERIEYGTPAAVTPDEFPVFPLVEEEARLLAGAPIDMEPVAVFGDNPLRRTISAIQIAVAGPRIGL